MEQEQAQDSNLGFFKRSAGSGIPYLRIFDGSICQTTKTETDGWEGPIETQHPITKAKVHTWVIRYDSLAAYIIDVERFKKEFSAEQGGGKTSGIELLLQAGGRNGKLTLNWGKNGPDPVLKRFLKVAPNIDFNKPFLISAWKNNTNKQAVSFRQGTSPDPKQWEKVEEYWKRPTGPDGKPLDGTAAAGADGSILPPPIQDSFDESWDYSGQNRFLMMYFMEKIEPKIKAIAATHKVEAPVPHDEGFPTHSGPEVIPVVTEKPAVVMAQTLDDMATGEQKARMRELGTQTNIDIVARSPELVGCGFDEMNKYAASWTIFQLENKLRAQGAPAPPPQQMAPTEAVAPMVPPATPQAQAQAQAALAPAPAPAPTPAAPVGDWGAATVPNQPAGTAAGGKDDVPF